MKDKFWLVIIAVSAGLSVFAYIKEKNLSDESREERSFKQYCGSKFSGSRPTCWSEEDRNILREIIQCKGDNNE